MRIIVEMSEADACALGERPFLVASHVHALVRRSVREHGAEGSTAVEYEDKGGTYREEAWPPGLIVGPTRIP